MDKIKLMTQIAMHYLGTFYSWGGDDPSGFDCSGFVLELLQSVGLVYSKTDMTAEGLHQLIEWCEPAEGVLAFRLDANHRAVHVGYMIDAEHVIHASGGGSSVKTKEDAIRANAFIKIRPVWSGAIFGRIKK
jgi:cell wall-associated NlpC family hydrolase